MDLLGQRAHLLGQGVDLLSEVVFFWSPMLPPVDTLLRIGLLAAEFTELAELGLSPMIAHPDGCVVVDARVRVAPPPRPSAKSW